MNLTIRRVNSLPTITVPDCIYVVSERNEASSDLTKPNLYFVVTDSLNNIVKRSTNGADIEAVKTELAATIASAVSAIYAALENKSDVGHAHTEEELEPIIRSVILPILSGYSEIDHTLDKLLDLKDEDSLFRHPLQVVRGSSHFAEMPDCARALHGLTPRVIAADMWLMKRVS